MKKVLAFLFLVLLVLSTFAGTGPAVAATVPYPGGQQGQGDPQAGLYGVIDQILSWYFIHFNIDDLKIFGKPKLVPGFVGNAVSFNGRTDYIDMAGTRDTNSISHLELSAWVLPNYTGSPREMTIIEKGGAFSLKLKTYGIGYHVEFSIFNGISWTYLYSSSAVGDRWTNISVAYDGASMSIFINGQLDSQKEISNNPLYYFNGKPVTNPVTLNSNADVFIGASSSNLGVHQFFQGVLDEVQFYLTPSLILQEKAGPANATEIPSNQTGQEVPVGNVTNATGAIPQLSAFSNATVVPAPLPNVTSTRAAGPENITRNAINATIAVNETMPVNGTASATVGVLANGTLAVNETLPITDTLATNVTLHGIPVAGYSNATAVQGFLPNATELYQFNPNTAMNASTVGKAEIRTVQNRTSLSLSGQGYLHENGTSTGQISNFTVSAWVKPDFSMGSSQFTVVGKERSFILSVNNGYPPAHAAKFSVFDGIRWHTVVSNATISQNWTHLAGTFNGTTIAIYVNGTLQNSASVGLLPSFNLVGQPELVRVGNITSSSDVIIGAYQAFRGDKPEVSKLFSGDISTVSLYTRLLNQSQIQQLYLSSPLAQQAVPQAPAVPQVAENFTGVPITPQLTSNRSSYVLTERPDFTFEFFSSSNLQKLGKPVKESKGVVQSNGWNEPNATISIKVTDPTGKQVQIGSKFMKLRTGKFDVQLDSLRNGRAGLYKMEVDMVRNGKTYTSVQQFKWGLVSLNTEKSIYRPGEIANFTIVVLDDQGHSVCGSNIVMKILDPQDHATTLATGNGITPDQNCGLYYANYTTATEGNYTVDVSAQNPSGVATFGTSFLVSNSLDFDIVRSADSKIDPVNNPNSFNVNIDVTSFTNASSVTIEESVPSVFNITTDASVQTVGDTKILTWNRDLAGNSTSVSYTYSVPLVFPQLYALGPVEIHYGSQKFTEARQWYVANDPMSHTKSTAFVRAKATSTSNTINANVDLHNRYLVAGLAYIDNTAAGRTTSVRYTTGSCPATTNDLTNLTATTMSGGAVTTVKTQLYGINIPDSTTGTITVCVTMATPNTASILNLVMFSGVNQTNPTGDEVGVKTTSNTNPFWGGILTNDTHDVLVDMVALAANTAPSQVNGQGQKIIGTYNAGAGCTCGVGMSNKTGGSLNPFGWTFGTTTAKAAMETATVLHGLFFTYYQSLPLSDSVSNTVNRLKTSSDSVTLSDSLSASRTVSKSLAESLALGDSVANTAGLSESLGESLQLGDSVSALHASVKTVEETMAIGDGIAITHESIEALDEPLALGDTVTTMYTKSLSESLALNDVASSTGALTKLLGESLALNGTVANTGVFTRPLAESLQTGDSVVSQHSNFKALGDSLGLNETTATQHGNLEQLAESLAMNDTAGMIHANLKPLAESLAMNDTAANSVALSQQLGESLALNDSEANKATLTQPLDESLALNDSTSALHGNLEALGDQLAVNDTVASSFTVIKTLDESVALNGTASTIHGNTKQLGESMAVGDAVSSTVALSKPLNESLPVGDAVSSTAALTKPLDESVALGDSATTIHGNTITLGESLAASDTVSTIRTNVKSLAESLPLSDSISVLHGSVKSLGDSLQLGDAASIRAALVRPLNESLPLADSSSTLAEFTQVLDEPLSLVDSMTPARTFTTDLSDNMPISDSASATLNLQPDQQKVNPTDTQITVSPSTPRLVVLDHTIQLSSIVIPSTVSSTSIDYSRVLVGGAAQISQVLNITKDTNGDGKPEIVVTIPYVTISGPSWNGVITLPTPQTVSLNIPAPEGQVASQDITMQIGSGAKLSFANATRILFVGQAGHHVGYYQSAPQVSEITTLCSADSQAAGNALPADGSCKIEIGSNLIVWTKHFTGFVTWHFANAPAVARPTPGAGPTGVGISGAAVPASITMVAPQVANLTLYQVSYNVCPSNVADIVVGTTSDLAPKINVITGSRLVQGREAPVQPFAEFDNITGSHIRVYEATLDPRATTMTLTAINQVTAGLEYVQQIVSIKGCQGTEFVKELPPLPVPQAPKIFGVSTSIGNGTQVPAETVQYASNRTLSAYALVTSNSTLHDAQIRFAGAGQNATSFESANMTIVPQGNFSSYLVNGTVAPERLSAPYTTFWIWARNSDGLVAQSGPYSIGVAPSYGVNTTVSLDARPVAAQGKLMAPVVYVENNSTGPLYGSVSLVANGTVVSQSPGILFGTGVSAVQLGWVTPQVYHNSFYSLSARGDFYGTSVETGSIRLETFPATANIALSDLGPLGPLTNETGAAIGEPTGLYSSFENLGSYAYKVASPDGTCIIGQESGCLIMGAALGNGTATVTMAGQNYTVEYTGPAAKAQRFAISSAEPLSGRWQVAIERSGIAQQDMASKVLLRITYSEENLPAVLVSSR